MKIINELMTECLNTVAAHYAEKARAQHINVTESEVQQAVAANWENIQKEVINLYTESYKQLEQAA